ncbi:MAG: NUDIX domain-containing protein [Burkholderiales bacterium]|nr:NUDIX domain-containing protein [Burkholderiales bacterium]
MEKMNFLNNKKENIVYQGKIIEVINEIVKLENGKEITLEKARRSPGVRLIIKNKEGKFILNKEKRHELDEIDYRLPGGKVFDTLQEYNNFLKEGKDILEKAKEAVKLEAIQEAGIEPEEVRYLSTSHCGATVDWDLIYFSTEKFKEVEKQPEEGEEIENIEVSEEELKELIFSGKMQEDRSVAVILKYLNKKE